MTTHNTYIPYPSYICIIHFDHSYHVYTVATHPHPHPPPTTTTTLMTNPPVPSASAIHFTLYRAPLRIPYLCTHTLS